jgi:hypothetical protein
MRKLLWRVMLGGLVLALPLWAASDKVVIPAVPALKASFEKSLKTLITSYDTATKNGSSSYVAALKELQVRLQKAGDLDGWTEVKNELDRMNANPNSDPGIPTDALSSGEALLALQTKFRDSLAQLAVDKNQKIVALSQKYITSLTALQTDLTKQGKMDEALVVNAEIKRVKGSPELMTAEFELPDTGAKPMPGRKESPPQVDPPKPVGKAPDSKMLEPFQAEGDVKTYVGKAPALPNETFKPLRLIQTPAMGVRRKLNVSALITSVSDESGSSNVDYYGSSKSSSGNTSSRVRVGLRTVATGSVLSNLIVVVEYYSKDVKTTTGKIAVEKILFRRHTIPRVDGLGVWIDYPEASIYKSSYKSSSTYGSSYKYKSGQEFYGIVISVYEADKTLIFQAVTAPALVDHAPAALPDE